VLLVAFAVVCALAPRPSAAQSAPAWAYPSGTTTGIASVDAAIAAATSGQASNLQSQFTFVPRACDNSTKIGGIACPAGAVPGTSVPVFAAGGCEGSNIVQGAPGADLARVASSFVDQPLFLYAVARATADDAQHAQYILFFGAADDPGTAAAQGVAHPGKTAWVDASGIVSVNSGCGDGVGKRASDIPNGGFILAPKTSSQPAATPTTAPPNAPAPPNTGSGQRGGGTPSSVWLAGAVFALVGGWLAL
ncbi:MAG: hypothetical protein ACRDG3_00070, partial [Tepidiformaceae bacterium]